MRTGLSLGVVSVLTLALLGGGAGSARANWRVTPEGAALLENGGESALSLRCDNNANTGNRPGWRVEVEALDLRQKSPRVEMVFRFPNRVPLRLMGDNRNGKVALDSMTQSTQSDLTTLVARLKAASRVTVTLVDDRSGVAMDPLTFSLKGSSRTIAQVANACR